MHFTHILIQHQGQRHIVWATADRHVGEFADKCLFTTSEFSICWRAGCTTAQEPVRVIFTENKGVYWSVVETLVERSSTTRVGRWCNQVKREMIKRAPTQRLLRHGCGRDGENQDRKQEWSESSHQWDLFLNYLFLNGILYRYRYMILYRGGKQYCFSKESV